MFAASPAVNTEIFNVAGVVVPDGVNVSQLQPAEALNVRAAAALLVLINSWL